MREVDLTGNNGFTLDNNEVIINHTDSSIIIEDKMNIFYNTWFRERLNLSAVNYTIINRVNVIADLSRVIVYLNSKYDGKPHRIVPTKNSWEFIDIDKMNISSFLPSIKEDAIKVLATDYKFLLDKLYKLL